tara:strand:- start:163 stop:348 length:186 start_codon:yes stop_codon:yes gene_type:complete
MIIERINPMTKDQILNMKFYAQQLQESLAIAYWAASEDDREYHTNRALEHLSKVVSIKGSV